ncbi:MAG: DNA polymerase III subunit delta [Rikenellaceae bacterium]|nr:DNA polymerase III subunit delta [Rikenellaceae bacterium]
MATKEKETEVEFQRILTDIKAGKFAPFYLFMGDEPYYADILIDEITERALLPEERGFNLLVLYGLDVTGRDVVEAAMKFPMMASRQVVIVREAQLLDKMDLLENYFKNPSSSTLLVLALTNKSLDKRTSLYKKALERGEVLETSPIKENRLVFWIDRYIKDAGKSIEPEASMLMADYCGTELRKLTLELDKLIISIGPAERVITTLHVEENIGISREYNVFELTKAISFKDLPKAFKIATHFGDSPKQYPLIMTLAIIFSHFTKILKYHAIINKNRTAGSNEISSFLGVQPYFIQEFITASQNYSYIKCMEVISMIRKCDSASKSNDKGEATDKEMLLELIFKILH